MRDKLLEGDRSFKKIALCAERRITDTLGDIDVVRHLHRPAYARLASRTPDSFRSAGSSTSRRRIVAVDQRLRATIGEAMRSSQRMVTALRLKLSLSFVHFT